MRMGWVQSLLLLWKGPAAGCWWGSVCLLLCRRGNPTCPDGQVQPIPNVSFEDQLCHLPSRIPQKVWTVP